MTDRKNRLKLAVFDLDGTLKQVQSPYSHVHRALGVTEQAETIAARYRRGELDYMQWGQQEIALWRDLPVDRLQAIIATIPYWPGAREFVGQLKASGVRVAIISAGFDVHVRHWAQDLGADQALYNRLQVENGHLTGRFIAAVDGKNKGELVRELQQQWQISPAETLAAGDTWQDTYMFQQAALAIAVAPDDPAVAQKADIHLADGDWRPLWGKIEQLRPGWLPARSD